MPIGVDSRKTLEKIVEYAKKYGFFYRAQEIYGGKAGFYDYGSLGTLLKRKFENVWREYFGKLFDNIWEIEPTNIMHKNVFKASKHLELFNDPITECEAGHRFRADKLIEEQLGIKADSLTIDEMNKIFKEGKVVCPICGKKLSNVKMFNLMFQIFVGPESGNLFLKLNDIKRRLQDILTYSKKLREIEENNGYQFETEDGYEFITLLKEEFDRDDIIVLYDDSVVYIFTEDMSRIVKYDWLERIAYFYIKDKNPKEIVEKNISKYENSNLDEEFENILNKGRILVKEFDYEKEIQEILEYYEDVLENQMFLRPETAQGPYVNFPIEISIHRNKLPLGLMVIGKAYRNEISPRQALLRLREFTQAELQIFFDYEKWTKNFDEYFDWNEVKDKRLRVVLIESRDNIIEETLENLHKKTNLPRFYLYFLYKVQQFYLDVLKIEKSRFRLYELSEEEKSFYNKYHFDVELYLDELGWIEVGGVHFRAIPIRKEDLYKIKSKKIRKYIEKLLENKEEILVGYDLYNHLLLSEETGYILTIENKKVLPVELELSFGVDRNVFALLWLNYFEERVNNETRIVLKLPTKLVPIEVAVFPLIEKDKEIVSRAKEVYALLTKSFKVFYDEKGSIGRRYRRQDSIGTPYCITVDHETLKNNTVTIRFRDDMKQIRVSIEELPNKLKELIENNITSTNH